MIGRIDGYTPEGPPDNPPDGTLAWIKADESGGYVAGSTDGLELLSPCWSPAEALDDLSLVKILDRAGLCYAPDPEEMLELDDVIEEFGFDPRDF